MKKLLTIIALSLSLGLLTACEQEGPIEDAAEDVDHAVEETAEEVEDAADETADAIEEACEEATDEDCG